jgi:cytochrome o ubiquinol oxidase subunit 2
VASVNQLVVPLGTPIEFTLTSATVMNAFFIPQLGTQIYTMPGMSTHLNLMADRAGSYPGLSSHFSGDGFSDMQFMVQALPTAEFDAWVVNARSGSSTLNADAYNELAKPSEKVASRTYADVDPTLYDYILRLAAPVAASSSETY